MKVYVEQATMSSGAAFGGLFNVATEDGRHFIDLTIGQFRSLAEREQWEVAADDSGEPDGAG